MSNITVQHEAPGDLLKELGIYNWPVWSCEVSTFPWTYESSETCYFLEGEVVVTPDEGPKVKVGKGDLVTFPAGMSCSWEVLVPVKKHYHYD